jgi:hypothetical protein
MKKLTLLYAGLLLISGCSTCGNLFEDEAICQERNQQLDATLRQIKTEYRQYYETLENLYSTDVYNKKKAASEFEQRWAVLLQELKNDHTHNWREYAIGFLERRKTLMLQRIQLVQKFQQAYPETWSRELLKYDINQKNNYQRWQQAQEIESQRKSREAAKALAKSFGQALKEHQQRPNNYWQERLAEQQYYDRWLRPRSQPTRY